MTIDDVCDSVAALLEPDPALRDDSRARPRGGAEWRARTTYLWPRTERFTPEGDGTLDRDDFALRMAWVADDAPARAGGDEDRAVSDELAQRVRDVRAVVAANRTGDGWEALRVDGADYEPLAGLEVRGVYIDISGYMLLGG